MVRTYQRKREKTSEALIELVLEKVRHGQPVQRMATEYGVSRCLLRKRLLARCPPQERKQVFTNAQEQALGKHLVRSATIYYGLSYIKVRQLAFHYAVSLKEQKQVNQLPPVWLAKKIATKDWLFGFMRHHPDLALRRPESMSLGRASVFNKTNVTLFFRNLKAILDQFKIPPERIWNMDETAMTTVQKPVAVVTRRGTRTVSSITSAERGVLVTLALCVSAHTAILCFSTREIHAALSGGCSSGFGWCGKSFRMDERRTIFEVFATLSQICQHYERKSGTADSRQPRVSFVFRCIGLQS